MRARVGKLNGHYILGGVGRQVAREFAADDVLFVVVDQDPQKVEECLGKGYLALLGKAFEDATLEEAGIRRARSLECVMNF